MDYVPQKVKDLFIEFFKKCSLFKGKDYKKEILNITVDEEERMDLEELFPRQLKVSMLSVKLFKHQGCHHMLIWKESIFRFGNKNIWERQKRIGGKQLKR